MPARPRPAPPWDVEAWLNTDAPLNLDGLRGKVVVLEAFQMLCRGCVEAGLPQANRVFRTFSPADVAVVGMHTVFEHHDAQTPTALRAFLHEYRYTFPVGIDRLGGPMALPHTMAAYTMQGTPTLVLIDRAGLRRAQHFGHVSDLVLGAEIMALMQEPAPGDTGARHGEVAP